MVLPSILVKEKYSALMGPNGAGKTTTILILSTVWNRKRRRNNRGL